MTNKPDTCKNFEAYLENNGVVDLFYSFLEDLYRKYPKPENPIYEFKKYAAGPDDPDVITTRILKETIKDLQFTNITIKKEYNKKIIYLYLAEYENAKNKSCK